MEIQDVGDTPLPSPSRVPLTNVTQDKDDSSAPFDAAASQQHRATAPRPNAAAAAEAAGAASTGTTAEEPLRLQEAHLSSPFATSDPWTQASTKSIKDPTLPCMCAKHPLLKLSGPRTVTRQDGAAVDHHDFNKADHVPRDGAPIQAPSLLPQDLPPASAPSAARHNHDLSLEKAAALLHDLPPDLVSPIDSVNDITMDLWDNFVTAVDSH